MRPFRAVLPDRLARKLAFYGRELAFAARAPASLDQRLRLVASTAGFHYRNWPKQPPDAGPRMQLDLDVSGSRAPLTLRPRDGDLAILYEIFVAGAYEIPETELDPAGVRVIVDAGANIGCSALYFARRYPNARILAVEPNPDNFALLTANTAHEPRIVPVEACLTGRPGQNAYIATTGRASHFSLCTDGAEGVRVRGMSLTELADQHAVARIDLLKIDVEGAEREIFSEPRFLPRVGMIIAELHGSYDVAHFNADLAPWGFAARQIDADNDPALVLAQRG